MCSNEGAFVPGSTHTGTILNRRRNERPVSSIISHHCYSSNCHFDTIVIRVPSYIGKTSINIDSRSSTKLLQLFAFLVVLALLPTTIMTHPLSDGARSSNDRSSRGLNAHKAYWVDPCRGNVPTASSERRSSDQLGPADNDTLNAIYKTTLEARIQADKFRDDYVRKTFESSFLAHHRRHKSDSYNWLRNNFIMPIDLNEKATTTHLEKLMSQPQEEVLKIYGFLQRLAVAFDQIVNDNVDDNTAFKREFEEAKRQLGYILCEIRDFLDDDLMKSYEDATYDTMPENFRHFNDRSHRDLRDWLIFRDYMILLEYILQVMSYFQKKINVM